MKNRHIDFRIVPAALALAAGAMLLSGCGNKGPLTLPSTTSAQTKPASVTQPSKPAADNSSASTTKE